MFGENIFLTNSTLTAPRCGTCSARLNYNFIKCLILCKKNFFLGLGKTTSHDQANNRIQFLFLLSLGLGATDMSSFVECSRQTLLPWTVTGLSSQLYNRREFLG